MDNISPCVFYAAYMWTFWPNLNILNDLIVTCVVGPVCIGTMF